MSRENTSLPRHLPTPPAPPATKTIPAAGGESRFSPPLSLFFPSSPPYLSPTTSSAQTLGRTTTDPAGTPTQTRGGPRQDSHQGHQQPVSEEPRKGRKAGRAGRATEGPRKGHGKARRGPDQPDPQGPRKRPREVTQGHQKTTARPPPADNQQPRNRKKGHERPTKGHRQGQTGNTTGPAQRPRKGPRKARKRAISGSNSQRPHHKKPI